MEKLLIYKVGCKARGQLQPKMCISDVCPNLTELLVYRKGCKGKATVLTKGRDVPLVSVFALLKRRVGLGWEEHTEQGAGVESPIAGSRGL